MLENLFHSEKDEEKRDSAGKLKHLQTLELTGENATLAAGALKAQGANDAWLVAPLELQSGATGADIWRTAEAAKTRL